MELNPCLVVTHVLYLMALVFCVTYAFSVSENQLQQESVPYPLENHRIVQGMEASIRDYPHQVAMYINNLTFCGGSIISTRYIMTAAHCVFGYIPGQVLVLAGSSSRFKGSSIPIAEIYVHPNYNTFNLDNDVAICKTRDRIIMTMERQTIELPPALRMMVPNSQVKISGWGRTSEYNKTLPEYLRATTITVLPNVLCRMAYSYFTNRQWCAGNYYQYGKGFCRGDSGGAAVQNGMAVGIVSYVNICGEAFSPSVFTDVAAYAIRSFIYQKTGL